MNSKNKLAGKVLKRAGHFQNTLKVILWAAVMISSSSAKTKMLDKIRCTKDKIGNTECSCPEDPITERYPDKSGTTCEYYYLCHLGRALKIRCPPYEAYHPSLNKCLPRDRIPANICKPLVNCPLRPNRYIEDSNDCTKYYLCYMGKHSHWSCPENTYFEPNQEKCLNDKMQTEACIAEARRNFYKSIGFENPPPKTSLALTKAKAYLNERKNSTLPKKG